MKLDDSGVISVISHRKPPHFDRSPHEIGQTLGYKYMYLVGGLEHFLFSYILVIIISIDFHIFQRGGPTTNQIVIGVINQLS